MSPISYIVSVLRAMFGVQSSENRERDFAKGEVAVFLVIGLMMTAIFMLNLFLFVNYIVLG